MSDSDKEIVREFLIESNENLDRLDRELVVLEKEPENAETLASVFRTIHTIKGTCGFLGFSQLEGVAHAGENLLSKLRDGKVKLTPERTTALLALVDAVREILARIDATGQEGERDDTKLIELLQRLQHEEEKTRASADVEAAPAPTIGEILIQHGRAEPADIVQAMEKQKGGDPRRLGEILVEQGVVKPADVTEALKAQHAMRAAESTIRVGVELVDKLMNLAGELVLARNQIRQFTEGMENAELHGTTQRLDAVTSELQESVMKTRMQAIGTIWSKFPRTVRDVAVACGKEVRIEMEGQETEMDKTIIEAIKDPLMHLVRNAVDHGIEMPEARVKKGKCREGRLLLRAYHEGGQVNIEILDDGAGLDGEKIRRKAVERGLVSAEQAARMSESEAARLIFLPGVSTAEKVTNVSGRGVGMDVVKTNIEKAGGTVDMQSRAGEGTTVRMRIPLTLAVLEVLMVGCAGERYAIPQVNLQELVRLEEGRVKEGIEFVQGAAVHRLRGQLLPLVDLRKTLELCGEARSEDHGVNIVVVQAEERKFGLVVDEIGDTAEIVVKPLGKLLKGIEVFAGASVMGDGKVALILDVPGVARRAHVITGMREERGEEQEEKENTAKMQTFLVFTGPGDARMALPVETLSRLEEMRRSQVERVGHQLVTQYRGGILPLVELASVMEERRRRPRREESAGRGVVDARGEEWLQVVVCQHEGRSVGLVVERILDIVEDAADVRLPGTRRGVQEAIVIRERVTELLDLGAILAAAEEIQGPAAQPHPAGVSD